jgi:hypothetical protein
MWRSMRAPTRRSYVRHRDRVEFWNGNVEPGMREQLGYLIWPACRTIVENRRLFPSRGYLRLRSDAEVDAFVQAARRNALP